MFFYWLSAGRITTNVSAFEQDDTSIAFLSSDAVRKFLTYKDGSQLSIIVHSVCLLNGQNQKTILKMHKLLQFLIQISVVQGKSPEFSKFIGSFSYILLVLDMVRTGPRSLRGGEIENVQKLIDDARISRHHTPQQTK